MMGAVTYLDDERAPDHELVPRDEPGFSDAPDFDAPDAALAEALPGSPLPPPTPAVAEPLPRSRAGRLAAAAVAFAALSAALSYATVKLTDDPDGGVSSVATAAPYAGPNASSIDDLPALL